MNDHEQRNPPQTRVANIAMALLAAQSGCFSLIIIIVALFLGLWLDAQSGQRGPFTVGLLLLSIPISLFVMVRMALGAVSQIKPPPSRPSTRRRESDEEEG
jgi:hypothetical protein